MKALGGRGMWLGDFLRAEVDEVGVGRRPGPGDRSEKFVGNISGSRE